MALWTVIMSAKVPISQYDYLATVLVVESVKSRLEVANRRHETT